MTKDFSVYVLDPLEEFLSKGGQSQPSGGVAVGMGPLSSIVSPLSRDESLVVGAIVECGMGETALEVVISLRQVRIRLSPSTVHLLTNYVAGALISKLRCINLQPTTGCQTNEAHDRRTILHI